MSDARRPPLLAAADQAEWIEATYLQARAARLARERETGRRTYTVRDPWAQRPGVSTTGSHLWAEPEPHDEAAR